MSERTTTTLIVIALIVAALATWFVTSDSFRQRFSRPPPQTPITWEGDEPAAVLELGICQGKKTVEVSREVELEPMSPRALLAIRGATDECFPIAVTIVRLRPNQKPVTHQSATTGGSSAFDRCPPQIFEVKLNVPREPGTYQLKVFQQQDHILAHGTLVVKPK